jgi:hypothetical protein
MPDAGARVLGRWEGVVGGLCGAVLCYVMLCYDTYAMPCVQPPVAHCSSRVRTGWVGLGWVGSRLFLRLSGS